MKKTHIIIGASAAGIGVIQRIMRLAPNDIIICIAAEPQSPYNTCFLADYCAGNKTEHELSIFDCARAVSNLQMRLGVAVERIDAFARQVILADRSVLAYDTLFIGTGTSAIIPPIPGINECAGVFTFHTMADCQRVMEYRIQQSVTRAIVIGAGLTGLEVADALATCGVTVSVVERQARVLKQLVGASTATFIQSAIKQAGVNLYLNDAVVRVCSRDQKVVGVELASGTYLDADMVVVAVGASRNSQLARTAGIAVSELGIITDEYMRTSQNSIWAGGDVAQVTCAFTGEMVSSCTWPDAMLQGLTAAHAMVGMPKIYAGAQRIVDSAFFGLRFQAGGALYARYPEQEFLIENNAEGVSAVLLMNQKVVGYAACSVHEVSRSLRKMMLCGEMPSGTDNS